MSEKWVRIRDVKTNKPKGHLLPPQRFQVVPYKSRDTITMYFHGQPVKVPLKSTCEV